MKVPWSLGDVLCAGELSDMVGARLSGNAMARIKDAATDSRKVKKDFMFVALPGENTHGARFVQEAVAAGASVILVDKKSNIRQPDPSARHAIIYVENAESSLHEMARKMRANALGLRVVGITGSNGKTTTKEILASILCAWKGSQVLVSRGNYNSVTGLPISLMRLRKNHSIAILEMAMDRRGEMAQLAQIAHPDVAVITNVGTAHVGRLGSREILAGEKRNILKFADSKTVAVIGAEEEYKEFLLQDFPGRRRFFGSWDGDKWQDYRELGKSGYLVRYKGCDLRFRLAGMHNLINAMAAVEAAEEFGAPTDCIVKGLEVVRTVPGRCEIISGDVDVILDCYNANPESLVAALRLLSTLGESKRCIAVLGDMFELGGLADSYLHRAGLLAVETGLDVLFAVGDTLEPMINAMAGAKVRIEKFAHVGAMKEVLYSSLQPGDCVLIKASRKMAFEQLVPELKEAGFVESGGRDSMAEAINSEWKGGMLYA